MTTYHIKVIRKGYGSRVIEVEAGNMREAKNHALDVAGSYEYSEHSSEYEVEHATEVFVKKVKAINIMFDSPPGPHAPLFIDVVDDAGKGINVGEWIEKEQGEWALRITEMPE